MYLLTYLLTGPSVPFYPLISIRSDYCAFILVISDESWTFSFFYLRLYETGLPFSRRQTAREHDKQTHLYAVPVGPPPQVRYHRLTELLCTAHCQELPASVTCAHAATLWPVKPQLPVCVPLGSPD